MSEDEKVDRPAQRTPLSLAVEFKKSYARKYNTGTLKNISLTGAFISHSSVELDPEDKITLTFFVAGRERAIQATVIWKNGSGCGIRFNPANKRDSQLIDDLIYFVESHRTDSKNIMDKILKRVA